MCRVLINDHNLWKHIWRTVSLQAVCVSFFLSAAQGAKSRLKHCRKSMSAAAMSLLIRFSTTRPLSFASRRISSFE